MALWGLCLLFVIDLAILKSTFLPDVRRNRFAEAAEGIESVILVAISMFTVLLVIPVMADGLMFGGVLYGLTGSGSSFLLYLGLHGALR